MGRERVEGLREQQEWISVMGDAPTIKKPQPSLWCVS